MLRRTSDPDEWHPSEHKIGSHHVGRETSEHADPPPVRNYRRRRASRMRSSERPELASRLLRPRDEVTVVEHHDPDRSDDYDYYDKDGMRVRVREI